MTALSQDLLMNENQTVEMPNVTASSFENISAPLQTIQIVTAGVPVSGVTIGSTGTGANMLAMNMATLVPNSNNYKSYRVFLSGSATNRYVGMSGAYSGAGAVGAFIVQFQAVSGFAEFVKNYKGNISNQGSSASAVGPGTIAVFPDNVIVCPADLTGNFLYLAGEVTNGAVVGLNDTTSNVWLTFVPIL